MCLGIPGQIIEIIDTENRLAKVDIGGVIRPVNIACIVNDQDDLTDYINDWVLVHVGFAMSRIDEKEAQKTLALLQELGEMQQEMDAIQSMESLP